jgi:peroxiredoxin Q/BCP
MTFPYVLPLAAWKPEKFEKRIAMRKSVGMFFAAGLIACGVAGMKAHAMAADDKLIQPGTAAPEFTLPSQTDAMVSLKDYKGKYVVLYFYPKDMTSGCTIEAHNFERDTAKYTALNAVVLGVSLDTVESHKTFCSKDGLNFKLLADPKGEVVKEYAIPVVHMGPIKFAKRETYLIGPDGKVIKNWVVSDIQGHSDEVLAAIAAAK